MQSSTQKQAGSLTIVGSGIESISQITLQSLSHIEAASKVFYCVVDPATEAYLLAKNKNCVDLYQYYDNGKPRMDTYIQMAEVMLREVRNGLDIVGVFYGHPGVFVNPSQRAIAIAKSEGYQARMLPGISAEDCLFADLGIDPCNPGCVSYEASDFLIRERPVNVSSHFILWQVGCIGVADFTFVKFNNSKFGVLLDRLEHEYGADHTVVHYIAAVLPYENPVIDKLTISQLRDTEVAKRVSGISTFYIPPKELKDPSMDIMRRLELLAADQVPDKQWHFYPTNQWAPSAPNVVPYGPIEQAAIVQLGSHTIPEQFQPIATSKAMTDILTKLALDPKMLTEYKADRRAFAQSALELTVNERDALEMGTFWALRCAMKKMPSSFMDEVDANNLPVVAVVGVAVGAVAVTVVVSLNDLTDSVN
uniref:Methyltransferase/ribosomally synthesized cyclic peptide gymnopeptides precursor gymMA1 n=1 Tax=Gymnopus fusipes TaxID=93828 RepID=GYMM1_GYMFU|nr:RecName: Full=Methyltransferase/ribosomally synthesized cyclic peptide gymnopeptides precursor gymMA1; AltName: Full=Gymnopeptides biosynthesis cluster protein MA1; Contains: RecName: Full=N-methyltranferase gymM1; Contains: RecName: Full=Ribosomally synthesized cyclic gymnopeptides core peptide; Contains: RecName: Full=Follower peptide; Flags: Precursor [Gymnopus fusipes]